MIFHARGSDIMKIHQLIAILVPTLTANYAGPVPVNSDTEPGALSSGVFDTVIEYGV